MKVSHPLIPPASHCPNIPVGKDSKYVKERVRRRILRLEGKYRRDRDRRGEGVEGDVK